MEQLLKPNVLQLIDSFQQGGSERQAVQLTRLLHESGRYRVHVACLNGDGVLRAEVERLKLGALPVYPLNSFYDRNAFVQLRRFARYLKTARIAVIHTHDFYTNIFGMAAATLARVPVRIASRRETDGMRTAAQKRIELGAYRFAHAVVANAGAVRAQLLKEGVRADKIQVVYNGLDLARLAPPSDAKHDEALASFGLPRDGSRRFVTIVANMRHAVKDQQTFLRAARRVRAEMPAAAFVLAGEGELMASLKAYAAELGLAADTFFLGRCARVPELLALSDVCVLSSQAEGFANVILEYMAAARPVVATDVGGAREVVVEDATGYLVPPGDDATMAARIIALLREPERARAMGEEGRRVVAQNFSCAAQLRETEALYDRLLAAVGAASPLNVEHVRPTSA
ncbi:MAG TPA: glycosyltransferase [Pyrinomonadaceae bacterium]|jgi:glycosyltransferase involved in cell wall biosynthesis